MTKLSVESRLTRELDIRFIDARNMVTEARLSLGIQGYPSRDQANQLLQEAIRIYQSKPRREQRALQEMNMELEAVKIPGSMSGASTCSNSDLQSINSETYIATGAPGRRGSSDGIRALFRR